MQAGANHEIEEIGIRTPVTVPVDELGPGEVGYLIAGIKDVGGARSGETVTTATHPADHRPRRLPRPEADGLLRPVPHRRRRASRPARRPREAAAQRRQLHLRARVVPGPRVRLPVWLPRPAAHGDRPRAPRAGVRPVAHRHRPVGGLSGVPRQRHRGRRRQPERATRAVVARSRRRADAAGHHPHPGRVHRHDHGAVPGPAGRDGEDGLPVAGAGRVRLRHPAGRGGGQLLRPAEEPNEGLRQSRLRAGRLRHRRPGQGRPAHQPGAGRRLLDHRPQVTGRLLRAADGREAQAS